MGGMELGLSADQSLVLFSLLQLTAKLTNDGPMRAYCNNLTEAGRRPFKLKFCDMLKECAWGCGRSNTLYITSLVVSKLKNTRPKRKE